MKDFEHLIKQLKTGSDQETSQVVNQIIVSYIRALISNTLTSSNLTKVIVVILAQQYSLYCEFVYSDAILFENMVRLQEGQLFQNIWRNTLDNQVSDGILLFNFKNKVFSVNNKLHQILGLKDE